MAARLQITMQGVAPAVVGGAQWAVTSQWAVASLPASEAGLVAILGTIDTTLRGSTPFKASISSSMSYVSLHAIGYASIGGPATLTADSTNVTPLPGTGAAGDPRDCVVVTERTGAAGPSYRGRSYWPWAKNYSGDGLIPSADQAIVRAGWKAFHDACIAALSGASLSPIHVVYSRKTNEMTPIAGYCTGNRTDRQRHRAGRGRETYICDSLTQSLEVEPAQLGDQYASMDPETLQAVVDLMNNGMVFGSIDLGPLKTAWEVAQTIIALKAAAAASVAEGDEQGAVEDGQGAAGVE